MTWWGWRSVGGVGCGWAWWGWRGGGPTRGRGWGVWAIVGGGAGWGGRVGVPTRERWWDVWAIVAGLRCLGHRSGGLGSQSPWLSALGRIGLTSLSRSGQDSTEPGMASATGGT